MRFGARLREAAGGLETTLRVRRRVVSELASDLEDLYGAYRAEGVPGPEARRRAEALLAPTAEVLAALSHIHRPFLLRIGDRFSEAGRNRLEWAMLVVVTTAFCAIAVGLLLRVGMVPGPAPYAAVILGLAFVSLMYALGRWLGLYLNRWPGWPGRRVDGWVLAASGCATLVVAALGVLVGLWEVAKVIEANPVNQAVPVLRWIRGASGLGTLGLLVALADGMGLLVLRRRVSVLVDEAYRWRDPVSIVDQGAAVKAMTRTG